MSLYSDLIKVYDDHVDYDDLIPLNYAPRQVALQININESGKLLTITPLMERNEHSKEIHLATEMIPVTPKSAYRTNSVIPHLLCDSLLYLVKPEILKRYGYLNANKSSVKYQTTLNRSGYEKYMNQLEEFVEKCQHTIPELNAIMTYLKSDSLMSDLIQAQFVAPDSNLKCKDSPLYLGTATPLKTPICINVHHQNSQELIEVPTWRTQIFQDTWQKYRESFATGPIAVSSVTGCIGHITNSYPTIGLRNSKAKLMSANNSANYRDLPTFKKMKASYPLGFTLTETEAGKIANALLWLGRHNVWTNNDIINVLWQDEYKTTSKLITPNQAMTAELFESIDITLDASTLNTGKVVNDDLNELQQTMQGNRSNASAAQLRNVHYLQLYVPDNGRGDVLDYQTQTLVQYLRHLKRWYSSTSWTYTTFKNGQRHQVLRTPTITDIIGLKYLLNYSYLPKKSSVFMFFKN